MTDCVLDIEVRPTGDHVTLALTGELTMGSTGALTACLEELHPDVRCVVLDMSGVTFLDSSGVAVLVQAHHRLRSELRQLELHEPPDRVQMVLEITGVLDVLTILRVDHTTA